MAANRKASDPVTGNEEYCWAISCRSETDLSVSWAEVQADQGFLYDMDLEAFVLANILCCRLR